MFTTKQGVDEHISYILQNISDEKERSSRGYQFAKLYYDVADYDSSKRYLHTFLQEAVPGAHTLMGLVYEALKDKNNAIEAYTRSLDINPNQKDLVLKVSELYVAVNADNVKNREILRPNPTRVDVQMEVTPTALSSRLSILEETLRNNEKQILELFTHLRESRDEIRNLREQVQNWLFQGLTIMSTARSPMSHSFSGTAHATRNMENTPTSSCRSGVPFSNPSQDGTLPHMSQYGYTGGNSRSGSAYGHHNYDEDFHNIDAQGEYFAPDQNLVKEWPFGQKAGVEGKSTIIYSPQGQGRVTNPPNAAAGMYTNALRGQSIQYGTNQRLAAAPMSNMAPQMPEPGFFSQSYHHMTPPPIQSQSGLFQSQGQFGVMPGKPGVFPTMTPARNKNAGTQNQTVVNNSLMMPPNEVASQSTVKPTLIPGSVGVPPPKKEEKALSQNGLLSTPNVMPFAALSIYTSAATTVTPEPAASSLRQLASKHQDDTQSQGSVSTPLTQSTLQKPVFQGFSFTSTPKIAEQKTDKLDKNIPATTAAAAKPFGGFSFTTSSQSVTTKSLSGFGTQSVSQSQSTVYPFTIGQNTGSSLSFGSVGVPTPTKEEKARSQNGLLSTPNIMLFAAPSISTSAATTVTPGPAVSRLSQLASEHQDDTQGQGSVSAPSSQYIPPKTLFQGFSFKSTPKIAERKTDKPDKNIPATTAAAAKPFGGFSFTTSSQSVTTKSLSGLGTQSVSQSQSTDSPFTIGQNTGSSLSFGRLAAQGQTSSAFQAAGDSKGFMGAGQPLFGKSLSSRRRNVSGGSDDHKGEYEPNVDFKPVVPLPDLIEVKTGEEDEEKLFCERTKLFRFDKQENQWKERGIGEIKILKHQQSKKVRIMMRREQVLKLCANHKITKDMKLTPMSSSDRAWVWNAMDFAEEEVRYETFAIIFKNPDIAQRFKDAFETCQADIKDSFHEDVKIEKKTTNSVKSDSEARKGDLSSLFKQIPGAWTCDGCYIQNNSDILMCPCCNTLKPGVKPEDVKTSTPAAFSSSTGSGFKFGTQPTDQSGSQSGSGFKFGTQPTDSGSGATSGSGFKFETPTKTGPPSGTGIRFETPTLTETSQTSFPFGSKPADSTKTSNTPSSTVSGFKFTTAALTATSPQTSKNTFVSGTTNTVTTSRPITTKTSGTGFDLPEIFKASSGFQFGGASSQTPDSTNAASSAGFNVNKDATKYSFGSPSKNTAVDSDASKPAENKSNLSGSLLAQFLSSPNSWKCDGCLVNNDGTLDKCPCCGTAQSAAKADNKKESGFVSSAISSSSNSVFKFGSSSGFGSGSSETFSKTAFPSSTEKAGNSSGFSFGTPTKSTSEGFKFSLNPADSPMKQAPASLGSGFNFSLSMNANTKVKRPKSPEVNDDGYYVEDEGSHIHFEPVIDLPDKVDVKTGEEDEDVLFSHRAKLYRFDKGEWKERGLGDVKVLFQLEIRKARIVMRREQILKLCCNHYIVPELRLKPMPNSMGCALVWFAIDCADGQPRSEQFAIKFKNVDIATEFETAVEDAKSKMSGGTIKSETSKSPTTGVIASSHTVETIGASSRELTEDIVSEDDVVFVKEETATEEEIKQARALMLPDHFYMYKKRPSCRGCLGCDTSGDDEENDELNDDQEEDNPDKDEDYEVKDDEYDEKDDDENDGDDNDGVESDVGVGQTDSKCGGFVFGGASSTVSFSSLAQSSNTQAFKTDDSKPFHWQGAGRKLFGATDSASDGDDSGDEGDKYQGEHPHIETIVPLPELIEVKTGEENETVQFKSRAKLFRFDKEANQWKEKGIGEMKILKNKETGKYRLLLQREQVHKLACNHLLTSELALKPMNTSETSWCWTAQDFCDSEPRIEQLAVKFQSTVSHSTGREQVRGCLVRQMAPLTVITVGRRETRIRERIHRESRIKQHVAKFSASPEKNNL